MGSYLSSYILCPFYHGDDAQKIKCEGVVDGNTLHVVFGSSTVARKYKRDYCCKEYKECRIAKMLYAKYAEEDDY